MLSGILAIAQFLAGLVTLVQSLVNQYNKDQDIEQGRLEEQAVQQTQKAKDEAIANTVYAQPVPTDKHRILDGM